MEQGIQSQDWSRATTLTRK